MDELPVTGMNFAPFLNESSIHNHEDHEGHKV
jgi:hypothetical protein